MSYYFNVAYSFVCSTVLFCEFEENSSMENFKQLLIAVCAVVVADFWFIVPFLDYFQFEYRSTELNLLGKMNAHGTFLSQLFALFPRGTGDAYTIDGGIGQTGEDVISARGCVWDGGSVLFPLPFRKRER